MSTICQPLPGGIQQLQRFSAHSRSLTLFELDLALVVAGQHVVLYLEIEDCTDVQTCLRRVKRKRWSATQNHEYSGWTWIRYIISMHCLHV